MNKRLFLLTALLLLPSCQWSIGESIRSGSMVRVGADITQATRHYVNSSPPREGVFGLYKAEDYRGRPTLTWHRADDPGTPTRGGQTPFVGAAADAVARPRTEYMLAPEVTYRLKRRSFVHGQFTKYTSASKASEVYDVSPTGRMVWVKPQHKAETQRVDSLPEGLREEQAHPFLETHSRDILGDFDSPLATRGSFGAQMLAAPFDFAIDPVLSAVGTTLYAGVLLIVLPLCAVSP